MTKLQDALIEAGVKTLDYTDTKADKTITFDIDKVPDETIVSQLHYGRRMFNDALNSGDQDKRDENRAALTKRLQDGWTRGHGGGKRLDPTEREAREAVVDLMVEAKFKASEARKMVSADGAESTFRAHLADDDDKWATVRAHAEAIAAMRAKAPSI